MSDLLEKCTVCHGMLDEEDLFCPECGTEAPDRSERHSATTTSMSTHNFNCNGCGASMSYSAEAGTLRCPFCGSEKLTQEKPHRTLNPKYVVSFEVNEATAGQRLREAIGKGFFRPPDLAREAKIVKMTPVYVPYWSFKADVFTNWTGDTNQTPRGARAGWYPLSGQNRASHNGLLVGASGVLTPTETHQICPFNLGKRVAPDELDLDNITVEQFSVSRKYARPLARYGLEQKERETVATQCIPGSNRNIKVNLRIHNLASEPILLPVWIMAYRYKDEVYRFLVNGQTGRSTGQAPTSYTRLIKVVGIVVVVLFAMFLLLMLCGGLASALGHAQPHGMDQFASRFTDQPNLPNLAAICYREANLVNTCSLDSTTHGQRSDLTAGPTLPRGRPQPAASVGLGDGGPVGGSRAVKGGGRRGQEAERTAGSYLVRRPARLG